MRVAALFCEEEILTLHRRSQASLTREQLDAGETSSATEFLTRAVEKLNSELWKP